MGNQYTYDKTVKLTFKNVIKTLDGKYLACDPGSPVIKEEVAYKTIKDKPCVKFDYLFNSDGSFKKTSGGDDYLVSVYKKFKNTDRVIPAYRTFNGKVLKADETGAGDGDSVSFITSNKDEIVFYEKVANAYGSKFAGEGNYVGGEITLKIETVQ